MNEIRLLDCTLRDGGFINDWKFGNRSIKSIYYKLLEAGVDIIEVGFIDSSREFSADDAMVPKSRCFDEIFESVQKEKCTCTVAMIDYGTCPIENVSDCCDTILDGIRVIFKKKDIKLALDYCAQLKDKGYLVFVQPVSITTYSDMEMLMLIEQVNILKPYAFSIVDTYGLMHRSELFKYFYLIDTNLINSVNVGYHSHNNFQLAYSNAIELSNIKTDRNLILDASCYGMGKGAGNANTELLAMYLNDNHKKSYFINPILEMIDVEIMPFYEKYGWGYTLKSYLAASNGCHPKYVSCLINKKTLTVEDINIVLQQIDNKDKLVYRQEHIDELYKIYQAQAYDDSRDRYEFAKEIRGKKMLLLGPGKSIDSKKEIIDSFIACQGTVVIAMNFIPQKYNCDFIFVSNKKRKLQVEKESNSAECRFIFSSNIKSDCLKPQYTFEYAKMIHNSYGMADNALILWLKLCIGLKIDEVYAAGFDGYSVADSKAYVDNLEFAGGAKNAAKNNYIMSEILAEFQKSIDINFLTESVYTYENKKMV